MFSQEQLVEDLRHYGVRFVWRDSVLEVHGLSRAPAYLAAQFRAQKDEIVRRYQREHQSRPVHWPPLSSCVGRPNPYAPLLPPAERIWPRKK